MYCRHCGEQIPDGSSYCPRCGQASGAAGNGKTQPPGKKSKVPIVIAAIVIVVLVAAGVAGGAYLFMDRSELVAEQSEIAASEQLAEIDDAGQVEDHQDAMVEEQDNEQSPDDENDADPDNESVEIGDYSDLDWPEMTWNFSCAMFETSTQAECGRRFGELMEQATDGKIKVKVYAADQLTNGDQFESVQALMDGDPTQVSLHSNLIYSAYDPRFNVASLPFIYDDYDDADARLDGEAGEALKEILREYGLHCMGIAENGFREVSNDVRPITTVDDMKDLKVRVAGSDLLMECYKRWGADVTNGTDMDMYLTYTALQQGTVDGEENPLAAIDAVSIQEVQPYVSMWDAIYDCLFLCINEDVYNSLTPEQQAVVDEAGQLAVEYQRSLNRASDEEIKERWATDNGVTFTEKEDMDIRSFKDAVDGVDAWLVEQLESQGYEDAQELVDLFTE